MAYPPNVMSTMKHMVQKRLKCQSHQVRRKEKEKERKKRHIHKTHIHQCNEPSFLFSVTKLDDRIFTKYILCRKCHDDHVVGADV